MGVGKMKLKAKKHKENAPENRVLETAINSDGNTFVCKQRAKQTVRNGQAVE